MHRFTPQSWPQAACSYQGLEQLLALCLQVSPVLSLDGLIASRKGDFGKGTNLGGLHQPPNQNNKTKLEQEKKKPYKATRITNRKTLKCSISYKLVSRE